MQLRFCSSTILKDLNLATRVRAITTDSGSEMTPAMELVRKWLTSEFAVKLETSWHDRCVCHIINRCVVDAEKLVKTEVGKI